MGYGYILTGPDNAPAIRIWVHVDDFAIHGQTRAATEAALRVFLDVAVILGLLCHPDKLKPPSQTATYTGFILDTRGMPTLRVPTHKREKSLAMVDHLLSRSPSALFSKLALAVLAGSLESLAEATPSRIGHTHLRHLYDVIHDDGAPTGARRYHAEALIPVLVRADLLWWRTILTADMARVARPLRAGTLIPSYGDGSGTGTGGTFALPGKGLVAWMGRWTPYVFTQSSNWKELKTLSLTLQRLSDHHSTEVRGATLFYFTDNSATYYICSAGSSRSPGLQALVEQIRKHELILGCTLQVIHIPGSAMILQGTDGLSRGLWLSSLRPQVDQHVLTESIFRPASYDASHVGDYAALLGWDPATLVRSRWESPLTGGALLHRFTVHHPPPRVGAPNLDLLPRSLGRIPVGHRSPVLHPPGRARLLARAVPPHPGVGPPACRPVLTATAAPHPCPGPHRVAPHPFFTQTRVRRVGLGSDFPEGPGVPPGGRRRSAPAATNPP